jgi:hypothetical protein
MGNMGNISVSDVREWMGVTGYIRRRSHCRWCQRRDDLLFLGTDRRAAVKDSSKESDKKWRCTSCFLRLRAVLWSGLTRRITLEASAISASFFAEESKEIPWR